MYIHKNFAYFLYFSIVNILNSGIIIFNIMLFENLKRVFPPRQKTGRFFIGGLLK